MGRCGGDLEGGRLRALLHPPPLLLIDRGRVLKKNLQSELLTLSDLLQQLREQGVDDVAQVKRCYLESDGKMSVIRQSSPTPESRGRAGTARDAGARIPPSTAYGTRRKT